MDLFAYAARETLSIKSNQPHHTHTQSRGRTLTVYLTVKCCPLMTQTFMYLLVLLPITQLEVSYVFIYFKLSQ